ncbi:MAG: serine/threonine protein kinase [Deltaproteobacteria bacterium]|nr:serine/threonine protein kinase [Deltaproteobacteria bacterium]
MTDSATLRAGSAFGRYTIQRVLGAGAFGAVYEATQQPLGKRVALKILHASQMHNMEALHRFTSEAEATAKLRHPHIVDVLDLGAHEGVPFIAMEYLEGESLGARLHREGRLSARAAVDLLLPVMSAVATVHDAAIVHRDLKPDNIFLAMVRPGKVQAKVLDFGIAKVSEARHSLTRTGSMMGTVFYMSPRAGAGVARRRRAQRSVGARGDPLRVHHRPLPLPRRGHDRRADGNRLRAGSADVGRGGAAGRHRGDPRARHVEGPRAALPLGARDGGGAAPLRQRVGARRVGRRVRGDERGRRRGLPDSGDAQLEVDGSGRGGAGGGGDAAAERVRGRAGGHGREARLGASGGR